MPLRLTGAAAGAVLALVGTSTADAASLVVDKRCYVDRAPVTYVGTGFTPGARWFVEAFEVYQGGTVAPNGAFIAQQAAPLYTGVDGGSKEVTINGYQNVPTGGNAILASVRYRVAGTYARGRNVAGNPGAHTRWTFSGFQEKRGLYVHVTHGGRTYTSRIGRPHGACGTLRKRLRKLPAVPSSRVTPGRYKLVFNQHRKAHSKGHRYVSTYTVL